MVNNPVFLLALLLLLEELAKEELMAGTVVLSKEPLPLRPTHSSILTDWHCQLMIRTLIGFVIALVAWTI